MLIKKLAVPFINNKVLHEAEHCYIATAAISEAGFDFVRTRVSPKCKIEIVTGLDELTSPAVLKRIWKHYLDRIDLRIYTKNVFHANVYIFDLPYRKAVAFTGSGSFTLEGLKDHEEVFNKTIDTKDIEELKSWFTGYFEFAEPLTEEIITEYERIYPAMKQRAIASREEKQQFIELAGRGFSWEGIKFRTQHFKKEDYQALAPGKALLNTPELIQEREAVRDKFLQLHKLLTGHIASLGLKANDNQPVSSIYPADHPDHKLRNIRIAYGQEGAEQDNFPALQIMLMPKDLSIRLQVGKPGGSSDARQYIQRQLHETPYRETFLKLLAGLGAGYRIEVAGDKRGVETFQQEDTLREFIKADDWQYYNFVISRNYAPGDAAISTDNIITTITNEFNKLMALYRHISQHAAPTP